MMQCPFCQKGMQEGFVRGNKSDQIWDTGDLYWDSYEVKKRSRLFRLLTKKNTKNVRTTKYIHMNNNFYFGYERVKAHYCPDCKKIIMDTYVEEDYEHFN